MTEDAWLNQSQRLWMLPAHSPVSIYFCRPQTTNTKEASMERDDSTAQNPGATRGRNNQDRKHQHQQRRDLHVALRSDVQVWEDNRAGQREAGCKMLSSKVPGGCKVQCACYAPAGHLTSPGSHLARCGVGLELRPGSCRQQN